MYPGEYPQPLVRKTFVQAPVVSGYVAARLQSQDWFLPTISGGANNMLVTYENVGNTYFTVLLRETTDRSISGVRTTLPGTEQMLCPGGQVTLSATNKARYLEVYCSGTTTGQLRMQIDSQRQWVEMAFDKTETTFYPTSLWQAKEQPGPLAAP